MPARPPAVCHTAPDRPVPPAAPTPTPEWAALLAHLPLAAAALEQSARDYGALHRRREVRGAADLLRVLLAYATTGWSLRFTAVWAEVAELGLLSEAALRRRFRQTPSWLGALIARLLLSGEDPPAHEPAGGAGGAGGAGSPARVRLIDASIVREPGPRGTQWRLHLGATVAPVPRLATLELTEQRTGETLRRHAFAPGDIAVADRAYCHRQALSEVAEQGAFVVVRYAWQTLPLHTAAGAPLDLERWLAALPPEGVAACAITPAGGSQPGRQPGLRLVAVALPEEAAGQARARLRRAAQRKGRTPKALGLRLAGYVAVLTTLAAEDGWDAAAVLALYRVRWQVELTFKRLKGLWQLGALRARTPGLARATLLARLLAALLAERLAHPMGRPPRVDWFATVQRPVSLWRWDALWRQVVGQAVTGPFPLAAVLAGLPLLQRHLCDPPRRRRQQAALARQRFAARPSQLLLFPALDLARAP